MSIENRILNVLREEKELGSDASEDVLNICINLLLLNKIGVKFNENDLTSACEFLDDKIIINVYRRILI